MQAKPNLKTLNYVRQIPHHGPFIAEALDSISQSIQNQPTFVDQETPAGPVNGTNTLFTVQTAPNPASSLHFYVSGVLVSVAINGKQITLAVAPKIGSTVLASYRF